VNVVPVGNFELTSSRSTNVNVWALLIVSNVIASNTKTKATLDMTGFTDVRFTAALNFGKALSHILVNGLLQSHRRGRWPLRRTPHGKRTARRTEGYVRPPEGVVFGDEIASERIVGKQETDNAFR